ncbi:ADP-dependent phosphofructokinase/glucokinase [Arthrobacter sp. B3I9]|uniref:ADP-dependent glucokinase/phosphofructokinase n=1 Tax=Arthrobacter sp. B3I9 TaxID=3042270 RepID=UPI0027917280|nr:ADP-dependent glucokinase/phosphofructokinase [Arthrobacter sp. B3I9]MDQ0848916.1 ADP-dependent phosphofructokinase/glucokinase [Arthrobacter sp. B3I9]
MTQNVVLGLGGTVDYEIRWDSAVMHELVVSYGIVPDELSRTIPVQSERDLAVTLLAFMRDGVGGERFIASSDVVEAFAARFDKRVTLGGTPVRAALAMDKLGLGSTVHLVSIDDDVRRLLPAGCRYVCSAPGDSTDPHLIVQFSQGDAVQVGDVVLQAPHSNRVIYTNDPPNTAMLLSDQLGTLLDTADVFLVSGLNVMNDPSALEERLQELRSLIGRLPAGARVVYEDAGFHIPAFGDRVRTAMAAMVDVYSLNEDEMQAHLGREVDLLDATEMEGALLQLRSVVPAKTLVVHTKYWSTAIGHDAGGYAGSLRGGITMASTRFCLGDDFTGADYLAVGQLPANLAGAEFSVAVEERLGSLVRCIPALALHPDVPTTIGLGDSFVGGFIAALASPTLSHDGDAVLYG